MNSNDFREFLLNDYVNLRTGRGLSVRAVNDTISRCNRIEQTFQIDLDHYCAGDQRLFDKLITFIYDRADALRGASKQLDFKYNYVACVRKYFNFSRTKIQAPRMGHA